MLDKQGTKLFLKTQSAHAVVKGHRHFSFIYTLANFGEPGAEWASQPIPMTLIEAPGFQLVIDFELLKFTRSGNVMMGLVLQDVHLVVVIKLVVQYSKNFQSSYDESFGEARMSNSCRNLVSCILLKGAVGAIYWR